MSRYSLNVDAHLPLQYSTCTFVNVFQQLLQTQHEHSKKLCPTTAECTCRGLYPNSIACSSFLSCQGRNPPSFLGVLCFALPPVARLHVTADHLCKANCCKPLLSCIALCCIALHCNFTETILDSKVCIYSASSPPSHFLP